MMLKFEDSDEIDKCLLKAIEIIINLREKTKDWHEHYGAEKLRQKKVWEAKADKFLKELKQKKKIQ